eukprot:GHVL01015491.1.p3 GENE.GHVL01015491.1~~GHVL01015491.1.p3  ORF type:complete len:115 (-),score=9.43 GHVL01015491.1:8-352(-)
MDLKQSETIRKKDAIVIDGYLYRVDRVAKIADSKTWRCTVKSCKARCKTKKDHSNPEFSNEHNHEAKTNREVEVEEFRKVCRKRGELLIEKIYEFSKVVIVPSSYDPKLYMYTM